MKWIEWTQKLQAIAQNGLEYSQNEYDIERYKQLQDIISEIVSNHTNHDFQEVRDYLSGETGYATPKIDVRGVVFDKNRVLLVKENSDGLWTLPGGWADIYESPSGNVYREVYEESGYRVKVTKLLAVYDRRLHGHYPEYPHYVYKLFFQCEIIGGEPRASIETSGVDFFDINNLPELSIGRVTAKQIHRLFELKDKNITDFD